jgi:hypothetical protein
MRWIPGVLLVLTACAPAYVQPRPVVYQTDYNSLFRSVVELIVTSPVERGGLFSSSRVVFEVDKADERSGLISAVWVERPAVRVTGTFGTPSSLTIVDSNPEVRRYVVQFVLKREGRNTSLVYSASSSVGDVRLPNRLVELVLLRLGDRFKRVENL